MATDLFDLHFRAHGGLRIPDTFFSSVAVIYRLNLQIDDGTLLDVNTFVVDQTKRNRKNPQDRSSTIATATAYLPAIMGAEVDAFDRPIRQSQFGDLTLMSLPIKCHLVLDLPP